MEFKEMLHAFYPFYYTGTTHFGNVFMYAYVDLCEYLHKTNII